MGIHWRANECHLQRVDPGEVSGEMKKTTGVTIYDASWHRALAPDAALWQEFRVRTFWQHVGAAEASPDEYAWKCGLDEPLRMATDPIWSDYCIQHQLPVGTHYSVTCTGEWAGVEIDIKMTPRQLRLVAPEWYEKDFTANVWVEFNPA